VRACACVVILDVICYSESINSLLQLRIYRVSIKSSPDYKHLLQENYCTWNTNIYFFKCNSRRFFTTHQYTSTCAPFVARRTSNSQSISLHVFSNMSSVIVAKASVILASNL